MYRGGVWGGVDTRIDQPRVATKPRLRQPTPSVDKPRAALPRSYTGSKVPTIPEGRWDWERTRQEVLIAIALGRITDGPDDPGDAWTYRLRRYMALYPRVDHLRVAEKLAEWSRHNPIGKLWQRYERWCQRQTGDAARRDVAADPTADLTAPCHGGLPYTAWLDKFAALVYTANGKVVPSGLHRWRLLRTIAATYSPEDTAAVARSLSRSGQYKGRPWDVPHDQIGREIAGYVADREGRGAWSEVEEEGRDGGTDRDSARRPADTGAGGTGAQRSARKHVYADW